MAASIRLGRRGVCIALRAIKHNNLTVQNRLIPQSKRPWTAGRTGSGFRHFFLSPSVCGVAPLKVEMPALSPTMEEGNLVKWLKKEGSSFLYTVYITYIDEQHLRENLTSSTNELCMSIQNKFTNKPEIHKKNKDDTQH